MYICPFIVPALRIAQGLRQAGGARGPHAAATELQATQRDAWGWGSGGPWEHRNHGNIWEYISIESYTWMDGWMDR